MHLDTTSFPLVWIRDESQQKDLTSQLDALLDRRERFVLIVDRNVEHDEQQDHVEKKRSVLWLKRNRPRLKQWCAGAIVVIDSKAKELVVRPMLYPISKAFGFLVHTARQTNAETEARSLLGIDR